MARIGEVGATHAYHVEGAVRTGGRRRPAL